MTMLDHVDFTGLLGDTCFTAKLSLHEVGRQRAKPTTAGVALTLGLAVKLIET